MPLPIKSWPAVGVVEVPVPPLDTPIRLPLQVPAVIVAKEAFPNEAAPLKEDVPETISEEAVVVARFVLPDTERFPVPVELVNEVLPRVESPVTFKAPPTEVLPVEVTVV